MSPELSLEIDEFRADSAMRLAHLKPTDTLKGLFLRRYLQLFDDLGGPPLVQRAVAAIPEPQVSDFLTYPYASMVQIGLVTVEELAPRFGGVNPWLQEMGRLATNSYLGSLLGRAFLAGFQPTPRTMLERMPWAIRATLNFGQRSVFFPTPQQCVFQCRRDYSNAPANAGAAQAAIEAAGGRDVTCAITLLDVFNYDLEISWK